MLSKAKRGNSYGEWLKYASIPNFMVQLVISTVGAVLAGGMAVLAPSLVLAAFTKNRSGGNFADHVLGEPFFMLLNEPYFVAPVLAAFLLGILGGRFFRSASAMLVWIVPLAALLVNMASEPSKNVWNNYFGKDCGASECVYEWLVTLPFYTSVAYTFGWLCENLRRWKSAE